MIFHRQLIDDTLYLVSDETTEHDDSHEIYFLKVGKEQVAFGGKRPIDKSVHLYTMGTPSMFIGEKSFEDRRPLGQWMAETYHDYVTKGAKS